ncbi:LysM peptidoglycan-binding domain-containing protein [Cohnella sp.]|uniref:LysM peptidoglycan-binding domain-containing protein n=1 Tax=Cohnella sp. TaxID=1883426 RepID=UPI003564F865
MKIHIVKQGDSLYSIAQKYGVSLEDIVKANPAITNPDAIDVGMKVKIPTRPKSALGVIHQHIVQQGDTLWKLSKAWGIQLTDLIKANPQLKNPNALLTGETVNIPQASSPGEGKTVAMHGKAQTGVVSGAGTGTGAGIGKVDTSVKAQETAPVVITPVETPAPQLAPAPAEVAPIAETKPIYGIEVHEQIEYIHYPVNIGGEHAGHYPTPHSGYGAAYPGVGAQQGYGDQGYGVAGAQQGYSDQGYGVAGALQGYADQGYGYAQPGAGGWHGGYGAQAGAESSYGAAQPGVGGAGWHGGYGAQTGAGSGYGGHSGTSPLTGGIPADLGGLYGQQDISYSSPDAAQIHGTLQGAPKSNCKPCGAQSSLPGNLYSAEAYANAAGYSDGRIPYGPTPFVAGAQAQAPSAVSPFPGAYGSAAGATSPLAGGYGAGPGAVSPFAGGYGQSPGAVSPFAGGYGQGPGAVSPLSAGFPGMQPGYGYGPQMGDLPVGFTPVAEGLPGVVAGAGVAPGYFNPTCVGGFPPIPPMPGFPPIPPMPPLRDDISDQRSVADEEEEEATVKSASPAKKRQAKPKPKTAAARTGKPKRKESMPWIKW